MTQALIAVSLMIEFFTAGFILLQFPSDEVKALVALVLGTINIGIGAFIPKVSATVRSILGLQRRGN